MIALVAVALAAPGPGSTCAELKAHFEGRPRPSRAEDRPTLWWLEDLPCPSGTKRVGATPPDGTEVRCETPGGRKTGWETRFSPAGKVVLETRWSRDREVGPRREWDPATYALLRVTALARGVEHGERVEWLPDGATLVTTFADGLREGPSWRIDPTGAVTVVEWWTRGDTRLRSCAWREGQLVIDL